MSSNSTKIEIYTITTCPFCIRAKQLLDSKKVQYVEINLDHDPSRQELIQRTKGMRSVPQIFVDNNLLVGGCDGLYTRENNGELDSILGIES